ncbi:Photosystem I P700 chlorophyll a apoprotein A1 [Linum perenne]
MFSDTAIQLQPVFAQWIQNTHALAPSVTAPGATASTSLAWGGGDLVAVGGKVALLPIPLGTADFLVHHIHAFTIHVTVLILLKGVLFARSSRLIPDKANLGFRFPCDGPGRGGTCQVSAWDHVFLGLFWMYNSISIVIFHFSWKMQSDVWGTLSLLALIDSLKPIKPGSFFESKRISSKSHLSVTLTPSPTKDGFKGSRHCRSKLKPSISSSQTPKTNPFLKIEFPFTKIV